MGKISYKRVTLLISLSLFFVGIGFLSYSSSVVAVSKKMMERESYYQSIGYKDYTNGENEFEAKLPGSETSLIFSFGFRSLYQYDSPLSNPKDFAAISNVILKKEGSADYIGSVFSRKVQGGNTESQQLRLYSSGAMVIDAEGKRINKILGVDVTSDLDSREKRLLGNKKEAKAVLLIDEGSYLLEMEMKQDKNSLAVKTDIHYWNQSGKKLKYGIYYGHDFKLGENDEVPVYSLGRNRGVYTKTDEYRLNYIFKRSKFDYPDLVNYHVGNTAFQLPSEDNPYTFFLIGNLMEQG